MYIVIEACKANLPLQDVPSAGGPSGSHVLPGDNEGAGGVYIIVPRKSLADVLCGSSQYIRAAVLPEVDLSLSVAVVQVSQEGCDHFEFCRHLPQVVLLTRGLGTGHKAIGVDLE